MEISLASQPWQLKGFWPFTPLADGGPEAGADPAGVTDWLDATVPGGVHVDLHRAGLVAHPYVDGNSLACEWVEHRWWCYRTTVPRALVAGALHDRGGQRPARASRARLVFQGIDGDAAVYVNRRLVAEHANMYAPVEVDVTSQVLHGAELELLVVLRSADAAPGQFAPASRMRTPKPRFASSWDISTRLVNIGLWEDVLLRITGEHALEHVYVRSEVASGQTCVYVTWHVDDALAARDAAMRVEARLAAPGGGDAAAATVTAGAGEVVLDVPAAKLWWPSGSGDQPLYQLDLALVDSDGAEHDRRTTRVGLRSIAWIPDPAVPEGVLPGTCVVNGQRIPVRGASLVPLDHAYGNVTPAHYRWLVQLAGHGNLNMLHVWGGGLVERTAFYDACDERGVLVWQDLSQCGSGVAGIDDLPATDDDFLARIAAAARAAVLGRRSHTSLALWCGGTDLFDAGGTPARTDHPNIALLRSVLHELDPHRHFVATASSGQAVAVSGVGHAHNLVRVLAPDHRAMDGSSGQGSPSRYRGDHWNTTRRTAAAFGPLDALVDYADCSQWLQAEGLRATVEAGRRRQSHGAGSVVWTLNEPWPNLHGTSIVDWFGEPKMAYYWAREAFRSGHLSLACGRLDHPVGTRFEAQVWALDAPTLTAQRPAPGAFASVEPAARPRAASAVARVYDAAGQVLHEQRLGQARADGVALGSVVFEVGEGCTPLFLVALAVEGEPQGGLAAPYVFTTRPSATLAPTRTLRPLVQASQLAGWSRTGDDTVQAAFELRNTGDVVALHVRPVEQSRAWWWHADWAYGTLLPGQTRTVTVTCVRRRPSGFLALERANSRPAAPEPVVTFRPFTAPLAVATPA